MWKTRKDRRNEPRLALINLPISSERLRQQILRSFAIRAQRKPLAEKTDPPRPSPLAVHQAASGDNNGRAILFEKLAASEIIFAVGLVNRKTSAANVRETVGNHSLRENW